MSSIVEEKIDRLEIHFKEFQKDAREDRVLLKNVSYSLLGSAFNGNKGIVTFMEDFEKRIKALEDKQIIDDHKSDNMKWFERGIIGVVFTYIAYLITHLK
jgi:hypothetical protein